MRYPHHDQLRLREERREELAVGLLAELGKPDPLAETCPAPERSPALAPPPQGGGAAGRSEGGGVSG